MSARTFKNRLAFRLAAVFFMLFASLMLMGTWLRGLANDHVSALHVTNAGEHFAFRIAELDRRWGREAFNLKTRLEAQRILEIEEHRQDRLLAYLIAQGSSIEFPLLRIENAKGEAIASYEYAGRANLKANFLPGQVSIWVTDSTTGNLYLATRQFIWLGSENGTLVLFRPMDHALLTRMAYPGTRLSLWWKGKPVASSDAEDSLKDIADRFAKPVNGPLSVTMPWPGSGSESNPELLVEVREEPALDLGNVLIAATVALLAIALATALGLGSLWQGYSRQLHALLTVGKHITTSGNGTRSEALERDLSAAQSGPVEELSQLALTIEQLARKPSPQNDEDSNSRPV